MSLKTPSPYKLIKAALHDKHGPAPADGTLAWIMWLLEFEIGKVMELMDDDNKMDDNEKFQAFEAEMFILSAGIERWLELRVNKRMEGISSERLAEAIEAIEHNYEQDKETTH